VLLSSLAWAQDRQSLAGGGNRKNIYQHRSSRWFGHKRTFIVAMGIEISTSALWPVFQRDPDFLTFGHSEHRERARGRFNNALRDNRADASDSPLGFSPVSTIEFSWAAAAPSEPLSETIELPRGEGGEFIVAVLEVFTTIERLTSILAP